MHLSRILIPHVELQNDAIFIKHLMLKFSPRLPCQDLWTSLWLNFGDLAKFFSAARIWRANSLLRKIWLSLANRGRLHHSRFVVVSGRVLTFLDHDLQNMNQILGKTQIQVLRVRLNPALVATTFSQCSKSASEWIMTLWGEKELSFALISLLLRSFWAVFLL